MTLRKNIYIYAKLFHIDESCESILILCFPQWERTVWRICIYIFIKIHFERTVLFYFLAEGCSNELLLHQVLSTFNQWNKFTQMWLNLHLTGFIHNWNWTRFSHRSNIRLDEHDPKDTTLKQTIVTEEKYSKIKFHLYQRRSARYPIVVIIIIFLWFSCFLIGLIYSSKIYTPV